eukprot:759110-Hanusia_phi.AAC.5
MTYWSSFSYCPEYHRPYLLPVLQNSSHLVAGVDGEELQVQEGGRCYDRLSCAQKYPRRPERGGGRLLPIQESFASSLLPYPPRPRPRPSPPHLPSHHIAPIRHLLYPLPARLMLLDQMERIARLQRPRADSLPPGLHPCAYLSQARRGGDRV